jgi:hypothetical protein
VLPKGNDLKEFGIRLSDYVVSDPSLIVSSRPQGELKTNWSEGGTPSTGVMACCHAVLGIRNLYLFQTTL